MRAYSASWLSLWRLLLLPFSLLACEREPTTEQLTTAHAATQASDCEARRKSDSAAAFLAGRVFEAQRHLDSVTHHAESLPGGRLVLPAHPPRQ
ncbi:hypothetical protein GCM10023185_30920 [Hymenobacter saemangeumensis]|uniref:DUF4398 domain-containing protein n=1 Tax=Hymenobacter saemangeumensis TaxID=1084522 RepID=A0ABP8IME8_9BACT